MDKLLYLIVIYHGEASICATGTEVYLQALLAEWMHPTKAMEQAVFAGLKQKNGNDRMPGPFQRAILDPKGADWMLAEMVDRFGHETKAVALKHKA